MFRPLPQGGSQPRHSWLCSRALATRRHLDLQKACGPSAQQHERCRSWQRRPRRKERRFLREGKRRRPCPGWPFARQSVSHGPPSPGSSTPCGWAAGLAMPRARARAAGLPTSGGAVGAARCPADAPRPRCTRTGHARPPLRPALPSRRSPLSCATRDSRGEGPWFMSDAGPGTEARRRAACGGESARESRAAPANHGARKPGGRASPAASCRPAGPRQRREADAQAAAWRPRSRRGGPASRPFLRGL